MNYLVSVFFFAFWCTFSHGQIELVLETEHSFNLQDFLYSTQSNLNGEFQLTDEKVFLRVSSRNISFIDEENEQLAPVVALSDSVIHEQISAYDHGVYYTVNNGSNAGSFKLCMIDNDLEVHEYFSHDYDMWMNLSSHGFFFQKAGANLFFFLEDSQKKRFFKFNTNTKLTEEIESYPKSADIKIHSTNNNGIVYSRTINNNRNVNFIDIDGNITNIATQPMDDVIWITTNDENYYYLSFKYENNRDSVFRFNKATLDKQFFSTSSFRSLYFKINNRVLGNYFHSNTFLGIIEDDTLLTVHRPISPINQHATNPSYYGPRLLNAELELFTYSTPWLGFELFKINDEDSLDLFKDLNESRGHGIPIDGCSQINSPPNRLISHNDEVYFNMTNGNDPNVYLYKITNDSLEPVLKLKDYNPGRIRYFTHKDYLYYFVFHSESQTNRLFRVRWDQMNDKQPQEIKFESETWASETSTMGVNQLCQSQSGNYITPYGIHHDNDNNIYINQSFRNNWNKYTGFERRNKFYFTDSLSNTFLKYTPYGELEWVSNIGEKYKSIFAKPDKFLIDSENNLQVYGVFHKKAFFDNDSLVTVGSARYYAKLDGETGAILEKKVLYETDYIDDVQFDQLIRGGDNYFYLAGSYSNFNQSFGDTTLISPWNFQNFLAKYDNYGNLIWIRNIVNNWYDLKGEINNIEYVEDNDEIVVFCSQNKTFCSDESWKGAEIIIYDTEGNEKLRKGFEGKYRQSRGKVVALDKRYYLIKGSINEAIEAGVYESSISNFDCYNTNDYQIIYDREQNKFISAAISDSSQGINIKRVFKEKDYIYFFGNRENGGSIVIQRFHKNGAYKGEKVLNQISDLRLIDISYQDDFFVLAMQDAEPDNFLKINPIFKEAQNVLNIARFQVNDWDYLQSYSPMDVEFVEEESNLFAYPNPTVDIVQINFTNKNNIFEKFRVVSVSGQILFQDNVPDQNFIQIDLSGYENGLYFIQFEGTEKQEMIRVIKQP